MVLCESTSIWNLAIFDELTSSLVSQVITIALGVAAICFVCNLGWNYLKNGFEHFTDGGDSKFPDYKEIARCIVLIVCISIYLPVAKVIIGTCEVINEATAPTREAVTKLGETMSIVSEVAYEVTYNEEEEAIMADPNLTNEEKMAKIAELNKVPANTEEGTFMGISRLVNMMNPANWVVAATHSIAIVLVGIIKWIIGGIAVIICKVLVIVGPLAFAFAILPVFQKQVEIWFSTLVTTCMVFTTLNILTAIMAAVSADIVNMLGTGVSGITDDGVHQLLYGDKIVALDCILIVIYCTSFWLTGKFVGKGDAGRIISKMVGTATALAGFAIGAKAAAGGGAALKNAASTGANAIEKAAQDGE